MDRIAAAGGEDLGIDGSGCGGGGIGLLRLLEGLAGRHSVYAKVGMDVRPEGVVDDRVGGELESSHGALWPVVVATMMRVFYFGLCGL